MRSVDFNHVEEKHAEIHRRLEEWAIWVKPRSASWVQPMFRQFRSADVWVAPEARGFVDAIAAQAVEKAVTALPDAHRSAVQWCYVFRTGPLKMCRALGVNREGLAMLVRDGRQMLVNRGVLRVGEVRARIAA
jgi:DNA-directed RNA polymerase specialized sigma24 family protein